MLSFLDKLINLNSKQILYTISLSVAIIVIEGRGKWLGDKEIDFKKGDICFYKPEEPHGFRAKERTMLLAVIAPAPEQ